MALQIFGTNGGGGGGNGTDPNAVPKSTVTAKGDLIVGTGSGTVARKAAGADGKLVKYDSTTGTGLGDADAVALAQAGQTPSQAPTAPGTADVGTSAVAARADHVHASLGLYMWFGTGIEGDVVLDGTTPFVYPAGADFLGTPNTVTPVGGVYEFTTDLAARNLTISAGARVNMAQGCRVLVSGVLTAPTTGQAIISADGYPGTAAGVAGATRGAVGGTAAGAGGAGNTGAGSTGANPTIAGGNWGSAHSTAGGAGASGAGGGQAFGGIDQQLGRGQLGRDPLTAFRGLFANVNSGGVPTVLPGGAGGGGGGGDGTNKGGGGGSGAGLLIVNAKKIVGNVLFRAKGGDGGTPTVGNCGGGGAGAGGLVFVNTLDAAGYTGPAFARSTNCPPGTPGAGVGTGVAGGTPAGTSSGFAKLTTWA